MNLTYKVWKFGPVSEELFIDLSSDVTLLEKFIKVSNDGNYLERKIDFSDDEFSDNDIELMKQVVKNFGDKTAKELVSYTHRENAPWFITAKKYGVLELLENESINNTEYLIDMSQLIAHDKRKIAIYLDFIESN